VIYQVAAIISDFASYHIHLVFVIKISDTDPADG